LEPRAMPGVPWWYLLVNISDMLGFAIGAILVVHIGQSQLLLAWHGPARLPAAAPVRFWGAVVLTFALGVAPLPWQPLFHPGQAIWTMLAIGVALLAGAATVKLTAPAGAERASGEPEQACGVVPADRA